MRIMGINRNTFFFGTVALIFHVLTLNALAQTATINAGTVYQTIDGFGGPNGGPFSWLSFANNMTNSEVALLFSQTSGIGLTIYRTNSPDGLPFPDLATMQQVVAQGGQIELSLSGPPDAERYSGNFTDGSAGASGSCVSVPYSTYASYVVSLIQNLASNGVPVSYIEVQTEPNTTTNPFGACSFSAAAFDTFTPILSAALSNAGYSPKLSIGSAYSYANAPNYFNTCIGDSACAPSVSIVAGHGYGYPDTPVLAGTGYATAQAAGKHLWLSETGPNNDTCFNSTMSDQSGCTGALTMAQNIDAFLSTGQVSNYQWWELSYLNNGGDCQNCDLVDQNSTATKRLYAIGNWSKFVRPGQVEISATHNPQSNVMVTAFENQNTGAFEIVAINMNGSSISQTFSLSGLSTNSVTPYVTDPNNSLTSQAAVSVSGGGFTATLTPFSVTTFVSSATGPAAPSHLAATIAQ